MRIVGGRLKGRTLLTPADRAIRPTSDRVREAVFNILQHGIEGVEIAGARVLDLFAGTGALGFEALSRGASFCLFVEGSADARGLVRENAEALGLIGQTRIFRRDATRLGPMGQGVPYDLAFLDPPYGKGLGEASLAAALRGGWLAEGAVAVLEESADAAIALPAGFAEVDRRSWGETQVTFLKRP
jgi:16S rRNA (guanine966-N2)-methyltransferase